MPRPVPRAAFALAPAPPPRTRAPLPGRASATRKQPRCPAGGYERVGARPDGTAVSRTMAGTALKRLMAEYKRESGPARRRASRRGGAPGPPSRPRPGPRPVAAPGGAQGSCLRSRGLLAPARLFTVGSEGGRGLGSPCPAVPAAGARRRPCTCAAGALKGRGDVIAALARNGEPFAVTVCLLLSLAVLVIWRTPEFQPCPRAMRGEEESLNFLQRGFKKEKCFKRKNAL